MDVDSLQDIQQELQEELQEELRLPFDTWTWLYIDETVPFWTILQTNQHKFSKNQFPHMVLG